MSYLRKFSNAALARHYQMYHNNEALEELECRELRLQQDALGNVSEKTDKQLLFSFAEREETGNNLSVEAIYEAGYVAGFKASRKDLVDLYEAAKKAGEELTYRDGRPVITRAMRERLPCPFEHSETEL